jgi:hypothetical protein
MKDVFVIIHVCVVVVFQHPMEDNIRLMLNLYEDFDMMIQMKTFLVCVKQRVFINFSFYFRKNFLFYLRIYA